MPLYFMTSRVIVEQSESITFATISPKTTEISPFPPIVVKASPVPESGQKIINCRGASDTSVATFKTREEEHHLVLKLTAVGDSEAVTINMDSAIVAANNFAEGKRLLYILLWKSDCLVKSSVAKTWR